MTNSRGPLRQQGILPSHTSSPWGSFDGGTDVDPVPPDSPPPPLPPGGTIMSILILGSGKISGGGASSGGIALGN